MDSPGAKIWSRSLSPASRLRIVVLGYIVRGPLGGLTWHHLQYVLGLARLGHEVYFVEDSEDFRSCYQPTTGEMSKDPTYGTEYAAAVFRRVGLDQCWAYHDAHTMRWLGPTAATIQGVCKTADLLLNLSGVNPLRGRLAEIPVRAFIDTDPVFTQVRHLKDPWARDRAAQHTAFFSFGENYGQDHCSTPHDGLPWQDTRQPIVLDAWPVTPGPAHGKFTTIMLWNSYPAEEYDGRRYGLKSDSFGPYLDLPQRAGGEFELAVGSFAPQELLRSKGWALRNPLEVSQEPWTYQQYLQQSKAEFTVAKHGYVVSRCGWFSERSASYLASGRPVLVEETGFSKWLPSGEGVLTFRTPEEALAGIEEINRRYEFHCVAARAVAEEYFAADKILPRLIEQAMRADSGPTAASAKASGRASKLGLAAIPSGGHSA